MLCIQWCPPVPSWAALVSFSVSMDMSYPILLMRVIKLTFESFSRINENIVMVLISEYCALEKARALSLLALYIFCRS